VEAAARQFEPGASDFATPGDLATVLDPRTVRTPALDLIDQELVRVANTPESRLAISIPPQEGKTTRAVRDFIIWYLQRDPEARVVLGSYNQSLANRSGRLVRNAIEWNPWIGLDIAADNGAKHEWSLAGHEGGLLSVGRGVGVSGRPADLVVIDDPFKEGEAQSEVIREEAWGWWTEGIAARFGADTRVVVIHTRWHQEDLIGQLLVKDAHAGWVYVNIPAQADQDPNKGQTDPLGREPGEFMLSARGRTRRQWEQRKLTAGSRVWNALYQGRPSPAEGGVFKRDKWAEYDVPLWLARPDGSRVTTGFDMVAASWDMAFKDTKSSDYVVGQVWGCRGADSFLLDQVRGRWDFPETLRQVKALAAKWPDALLKIVEDKANGTAVLASLRRKVPGLVPETPTESKLARASAVSPLQEAGNVHLPSPDLAPWVGDFIEECAGFPNGSHDDQVDAMSQALKRLILIPLLEQQDDDTDEYDYDDELTSLSAL
jgi:predicted phage terminase large subunit-like protein